MKQNSKIAGKIISNFINLINNKNKSLSRFYDLMSPNELLLGLTGSGKTYYIKEKCNSNEGLNFIFTYYNDYCNLENSIVVDVSKIHLYPNVDNDLRIDDILLNTIFDKYQLDYYTRIKFQSFLESYKKDISNVKDYLSFTNQEKMLLSNIFEEIETSFNLDTKLNNMEIVQNCSHVHTIVFDFSNVKRENISILLFLWLDLMLYVKKFFNDKDFYCFIDGFYSDIFEQKDFISNFIYFFHAKNICCILSLEQYLDCLRPYLPFFGIFHFCGFHKDNIKKFFFNELSRIGYVSEKNILNFDKLKNTKLSQVFIIQKCDRKYILKEKDVLC